METAFFYADIEEDLFAEVSPGFNTTKKENNQLVMKLGKPLRVSSKPSELMEDHRSGAT